AEKMCERSRPGWSSRSGDRPGAGEGRLGGGEDPNRVVAEQASILAAVHARVAVRQAEGGACNGHRRQARRVETEEPDRTLFAVPHVRPTLSSSNRAIPGI